MNSRIVVAVPGVIAAVFAIVIGGALFAAVAVALAILALYELYSLTAEWGPLRWAGYAGAAVIVAASWLHDSSEHGVLLGLAVAVVLVAIAGLILQRREDVTVRVAVTLFGVAYVAIPMATLVMLRDLPNGAGAVTNALVGVWVFDTASYFGGRMWGRRPIAPVTSPKKTVEGALVGFVVAVMAVWVAGLYMDWISGWQSLVLGIAICPAAYLGDLFESLLKRDAGVKDSGRILLGHGGVLDRFDALLFGSLAAYFVTVALVY